MTISWWYGASIITHRLWRNSPTMLQLSKLLHGRLISMAFLPVEAVQPIDVLDSGTHWLFSLSALLRLAVKCATWCSLKMSTSWSARMATRKTRSLCGSIPQWRSSRPSQGIPSEFCTSHAAQTDRLWWQGLAMRPFAFGTCSLRRGSLLLFHRVSFLLRWISDENEMVFKVS